MVARSVVISLASMVLLGGCISLDSRRDVERFAGLVERATDASAEWLLLDAEAAGAKTDELLADGLSAEEAMQVALLNNPRARAASLTIGVSRADFVQSTLFSNPTLALSFRFPDGGGLANFEAALAQNVAELWLVPARKAVARRALDRTILEAASTVAKIVYEARRAYVHALKTDELEAIARDTLALSQRLLEIAELRKQAGTGSELDLNLALTKKLEAETAARSATLATLEARSELARVLGLADPPESLHLIGTLTEPDDWSASPASLCRVARMNRLDLRMAELAVLEARDRAKEERVRLLKSFDVGVAVEREERRSRERNGGSGTNAIVGPTFGVELPLWDQNQAQIARADRLAEAATRLRDAMLIDAAQDLHSRLARMTTAARNAVFYRDEQLPAAERNVALSREAYRAGRLALLGVLEAERSYLAARSGYLDALEDAAIATIDLERVTGRPISALRAMPHDQTPRSEIEGQIDVEVEP